MTEKPTTSPAVPREFIDVKGVHCANMGTHWRTDMRETLTIRDHNQTVVDVLYVSPDGHFYGNYGKIKREDVGEYVLRLIGRMPA